MYIYAYEVIFILMDKHGNGYQYIINATHTPFCQSIFKLHIHKKTFMFTIYSIYMFHIFTHDPFHFNNKVLFIINI